MKKIILFAVVTAVMVSCFSGCYLLPKEEAPLEPPLAKPEEVEYKTYNVELGDIKRETIIQGRFRPSTEVTLSFEDRGGILLTANTKYGQEVKEGDLLFELDTEGMEMELAVAALNLEKTELYYKRVKSRTSSSYERRMAEIDMEIKQIAYDKIAAEIEQSKIYAPMDGIVTYMSSAEVGEYVEAKKVVAKVSSMDELRLMVEGNDALLLNFGDTVYISVTIDREKYELEGEVVLSPLEMPENSREDFEESTSIIEVKDFDTSKANINQTARITIVEESAENVIVIYRKLVKNYFGRTFVYVLEDGIKVERDVDVGITNTVMAEIREGLKVGDQIIMN